MKNRKMPTALAITMWAVIPAWTPQGSAQAGSSLPPQLQTDARREAARAARAAAASGESGGPVRRSNAAGDAAAVLGVAVLADAADAAAVSVHNAATRSPRRPDPVADRRGGVDPEADARPDDPPGRGPQ